MDKKKIIVILGSTSGGKTSLAVKLANKYNGEIISADSRQVYKGMDVGTGKDLCEYWVKSSKTNARTETGLPRRRSPRFASEAGSAPPRNDRVFVPHHLIDVVSPKTEFSLGKFKEMAEKAIEDILKRGKLPIIAGGTGLYLQALVDNYNLAGVKSDKKLRAKLEKKKLPELFDMLKEINFKFANRLHESDKKNKRRLIRYLEIQQKIVYSTEDTIGYTKNKYDFLIIGLKWPRDVLRERIYQRLVDRLEKEGMVDEVKRLHKPRQNKSGRGKDGVSWKRLESFGLEYKHVALYLQDKLEYDEMVEKLNIAIRQFAKRQMSWFRRWEKMGAKIHWVKDKKKIEKLIDEFIK